MTKIIGLGTKMTVRQIVQSVFPSLIGNNYFCNYDSRAIKVYEGPCSGLEGVSLTWPTEKLK